MQVNVIKNAKKNVLLGIINKFIIIICPFIERAVIQIVLGSQYLGLGSLYASIITVLSLSELGFSSAMVYNMYKPAAEGNIGKMNALLRFYKRMYNVIGVFIICVGLLLVPILPKLIRGTYPMDINLVKLYLIYLGNTALSYFLFAYLNSIIVVHQRDDINSVINSFVKIGLTGSQIIILVVTKNYYFFSLLMPCFTLISNFFVGWRVHRLFPQYNPEGSLNKEDKEGIKKHVVGTFIQQACVVSRNSLDSICVSAFLGLTLTAIYNNYFVIISGVSAFSGIIMSSFMGGIGNHVATKTIEENYTEMKKLDFLYLWVGGWCSICMICMYTPFMKIWMGGDMLLPMVSVILLCVYFYLLRLGDIRSMYSSAKGLWWEQRYRALGETILNLVLNVSLGKIMGINGIILATIISLFLCNYIWSTRITFSLYFNKNKLNDYYKYQCKQSLITIFVALITFFICNFIQINNLMVQLMIRMIVCLFVPNLVFYLIYRNSDEFIYAKKKLFNR